MPDISMCEGGNCPLKETCYRYKAVPNEYRQSYFETPPFKMIEGEVKCEHYWEINIKVKKDDTNK